MFKKVIKEIAEEEQEVVEGAERKLLKDKMKKKSKKKNPNLFKKKVKRKFQIRNKRQKSLLKSNKLQRKEEDKEGKEEKSLKKFRSPNNLKKGKKVKGALKASQKLKNQNLMERSIKAKLLE